MSDDSFQFGRINPKNGGGCCGKPRGCNMTHEGCLYLRHPWKRANVYGDTTVRCQATCLAPGREALWMQCVLLHGHAGVHEMQPRRVSEPAAEGSGE